MSRNFGICITLTAILGFNSVIQAEELEQISPETTQVYARHLVDLFEKEIRERQVKFDVDPDQAAGLRSGRDGIITVPVKGLKDGAVDPAVESENGAGLCYLFLSPCYAPLIDGKPVDAKKLRRLKFKDSQGDDREAICLLVTVKHVSGDDWRLLAFGAEKSPVLDARFTQSTESVDKPLAMRVSGAKDKKASLGFTLYKKYAASFAIESK